MTNIDAISQIPIRLVYPGFQDRRLLDEAVTLADQARQTLGFLPPAAFEQAAASGTLIVGVNEGRVIGYALYALPRQVVRLTHLCVAENM